jgi:hypothetical protein
LLGQTSELIAKQNREIQQIPYMARQRDGCRSATEPRRTEIAMEWLLIIMAIRLPSNLRRETFATSGEEKDETGQRFQAKPAPSTEATPLETMRDLKESHLLAATRQVHVSQLKYLRHRSFLPKRRQKGIFEDAEAPLP